MPADKVRDAVRARLMHPTKGWNAQAAAYAAERGLEPILIDFEPSSTNYIEAQIRPRQVVEAGWEHYPTLVLYIEGVSPRSTKAHRRYSGSVAVALDLYLGIGSSGVPVRGEDHTGLAVGTFVRTFNDLAAGAAYAPGVDYTWDVAVQSQVLEFGGPNWLAVVPCRLTCLVQVP